MLLYDAISVHVCVHGWGYKRRSTHGENDAQCTEQVIGNAEGKFRNEVGCRWNHEHQFRAVCQGNVLHLPRLQGRKQVNRDRMTGGYLTTGRGEEMRGMFSHHNVHISALVFEQTQDSEGLKGCNATGN